MRNWKKIVGLLVVMAVWLGLMWRLSTADGTETLQDSMRFARKIGSWIYESPTVQQLNHLNLLLRKLAHVFLYAILGGMMALLWQLLLELHRIGWRILGAASLQHDNCVFGRTAKNPDCRTALRPFGIAAECRQCPCGHSAVFRNCRTAFPEEVNFII